MIVSACTLGRQAVGTLGAPSSQKGARYSEGRYVIRGAQGGQKGTRLSEGHQLIRGRWAVFPKGAHADEKNIVGASPALWVHIPGLWVHRHPQRYIKLHP